MKIKVDNNFNNMGQHNQQTPNNQQGQYYQQAPNYQQGQYSQQGQYYQQTPNNQQGQYYQQAPNYQQGQYSQQGQYYQQAPNYQQGQYYQQNAYINMYPGLMVRTDRSLLMYVLLTLVTCGIYNLIFFAKISEDINIIATRRDGKETMNFWIVYLLNIVTCGIYTMIWFHQLSERIGEEARARGIYTDFGVSTFWLWGVLGSFLCCVGPFIYMHKLCQTMNNIAMHYNKNFR